MPDLNELRRQVALSCRMLGRLNLTREPAGHVSARIPEGDLVLIKGRGPDEAPLSYTRPEDLIVVDMAGKMVEGRDGLAAPNEVFIHTWLYRLRADVNSVIHVHPPTIVAFTIAGRDLVPCVGAYSPAALSFALEEVPTFDSGVLINSEERGEALAKTVGEGRACLMRGHGIAAAGSTVEEATLTTINLNELAEINYKAALLGEVRPLPDADLAEFRRSGPRRPAGPRPPSSEWRYYEKLIEG